MPHGEGVALASFGEYFAEFGAPLLRSTRCKIKLGQSLAKRRGSVVKIRSARPNFRSRCANGACGDKRFVSLQLETNPTQFRSQESGAGIVYLQCVGAAEIHRESGRRIHCKLTRQRPDVCMNRAAVECEPIVSASPGN